MQKNEPVLCPWCNQPMRAVVMPQYKVLYADGYRFAGECWCTICQATSPVAEGENGKGYATRDEAKAAAVEIALKRYEPGKEE